MQIVNLDSEEISKKIKQLIYIPFVGLFLALIEGCDKDNPSVTMLNENPIIFTKEIEPVWQGLLTAADPSIIRDGDTLRMYYSSLLLEPQEKLIISGAKSVDGLNWTPSNNILGEESVALDINPGQWDNHLEAVSVIEHEGEIWMYYCGYQEESDISGTIVATSQIGLAKSSDFTIFSRYSSAPILELGTNTERDGNALFSPTIIKENGLFYMFYVGYCIEDCGPPFLGILGATSVDGENWTKLSQSIIEGTNENLSWAEVIKEPSIVKGPDGIFYLFFTGDRSLGVARSNNILGPYDVYPSPILTITEDWEEQSVIAPSVIIENDKVRIWYMGVIADNSSADFAIGYAESDFPMAW